MAHAIIDKIAPRGDLTKIDGTKAYYESSADKYFGATVGADMTSEYRAFLSKVPKGGRILDAGSGSGRDTKAFLDFGYEVDAFDASRSLAAKSSTYTGQETRVATFETWRPRRGRYDGIWAFAALLHVERPMLPDVLRKLATSLKPGGWIFASFKYGRVDSQDNLGRHYTNLTMRSARSLFTSVQDLDAIDVWREAAPAAHGEPTDWVYVLAQRCSARCSPSQ
jgi:2-polyprenyl-3-methyl-5-hydroxy-6-metoxy-1,4-benzoquinol methylase